MEVRNLRLRDARAELPKVWLLDPNNNPSRLSISDNISNGVTYVKGGKVLIDPRAEEKGWRFMQPNCTAQEWAIWTAYIEQSDKGRVERPDPSVLPKCIRRTNAAEKRKPFVMPEGISATAPEIVVDLPDTVKAEPEQVTARAGVVTVAGKAEPGRAAGALSRKGPKQPDGSEDAL